MTAREAWRLLLADDAAACRQSFLDRPLTDFRKGAAKFTPKPLRWGGGLRWALQSLPPHVAGQ